MEFVADDKVLGRGGNGESLIDGQLKVNIYRTDFVNIAIAVDRVSDGVNNTNPGTSWAVSG